VTILYDEPRVLLVPRDHRLAGKDPVTLDDIAGKPMPRLADSMRNVYWRVDPAGHRPAEDHLPAHRR
jgi:DNA-binding transcriptional LysR family regulator